MSSIRLRVVRNLEVADKRFKLTHEEAWIMDRLIDKKSEKHRYRIVSVSELESTTLSRNSIKVLMTRLRKKIHSSPLRIANIPKEGYQLVYTVQGQK